MCQYAGRGARVFFYTSSPFSYFEQESAVFNKEASSIFKGLSRVVSCFTDEEKLPLARETLEKAHTPHTISTTPRQHLAVTAVGSFFFSAVSCSDVTLLQTVQNTMLVSNFFLK